jgi:uncharacterized protein (TIGR03437 family)
MKSRELLSSGASTGRRRESKRLGLALFALTTVLHSQTPGSIATSALPSANAITDSAGNVYTFGGSATGPVTAGAAQTQSGGGTCPSGSVGIGGPLPGGPVPCTDAYIVKLNASGNTVFATYLGGPTNDVASALALDSAGDIYVVGSTGGSFPVTSNAALASIPANGYFAAKLSSDGSKVLYATYLPVKVMGAPQMALDAAGNLYVTGASAAGTPAVVKLSADGSTFVYNRQLSTSTTDVSSAITVNAAGSVAVAGSTRSVNFPVTSNALQPQLRGQNAFVVQLDAGGNVLYATYLGGSGTDYPDAIQMDTAGNVYVAGTTTSLDFPTTPGAFQPAPLVPMWSMTPGGFIAKLAAGGSSLVYGSYVMTQGGVLVALGSQGDAYLGGITGAGFPVTASAPQPCFGGATDVFIAHLNSQGALQDASYYGGPDSDNLYNLSVSSDGTVLMSVHSTVIGVQNYAAVQLRFGGAGWSAPACISPDLLNAASLFDPGRVAPGQVATLTGVGIGPETGVSYTPGPNGEAPLELAGVQVFISGYLAPILYAQSKQVNVIVPFELSQPVIGSGEVGFAFVSLTYNNTTFGPFSIATLYANPALFRLQPGISTQAAAVNQDGTINGPQHPAPVGSVVTLFGTGFGANPACATGALNPTGAASFAAGVTVTIGGGPTNGGALVTYAGGAPTLLCGVTQVNMIVPAGTPSGNFEVVPWWQLQSGNTLVGVQNLLGATIVVK